MNRPDDQADDRPFSKERCAAFLHVILDKVDLDWQRRSGMEPDMWAAKQAILERKASECVMTLTVSEMALSVAVMAAVVRRVTQTIAASDSSLDLIAGCVETCSRVVSTEMGTNQQLIDDLFQGVVMERCRKSLRIANEFVQQKEKNQ